MSQQLTVLPSAARTATPAVVDLEAEPGTKGVVVIVDVTAITATPSITVALRGRDVVSGKTWTILTSAAITSVSTVTLKIYPGLTAVANLVVNDVLPRYWQVGVTHGDADSITYSLGASTL
jgi:hypothetical protein